jgi:hypothetical protein
MSSWQTEFETICRQNSIEPLTNGNMLLLIVPKMPKEDIKQKIREIVPSELELQYQEGPKIVTTESLKILFTNVGAKSASVKFIGHTMIIDILCDSEALTSEDSPVWLSLTALLKNDAFILAWKVIVNGKVMSEFDHRINKAISSRSAPERDICPTLDEILDLRITLENCKDVNDFIKSL